MYKTIKRNWLKKQIELGKVIGKCRYSYTDDYAFDNSNDFGKTEWGAVRMSYPRFEEITFANGNTTSHCVDSDTKDGFINLRDYHLTGKGGAAYQAEGSDEITLRVHSNLVYSLRITN